MGPKRGGMWRFPPHAVLPGFDLTTSATTHVLSKHGSGRRIFGRLGRVLELKPNPVLPAHAFLWGELRGFEARGARTASWCAENIRGMHFPLLPSGIWSTFGRGCVGLSGLSATS